MQIYIVRTSQFSCSNPGDIIAVKKERKDAEEILHTPIGYVNGDRGKPIYPEYWIDEWKIE